MKPTLPIIISVSGNRGKLAEFSELGAGHGIEVLSPEQFAPSSTPESADESGSSYRENALQKLDAAWSWFLAHASGAKSRNRDLWLLADDTGLEVEALGGAPGIYSARYAGKEASSALNITHLLKCLGSCESRSARFVSVLGARHIDGSEVWAEGHLQGNIAYAPEEGGGFGYDSIFIPDGASSSLAAIKKRDPTFLTHRGRAFGEIVVMMVSAGPSFGVGR